VGIDGQQNEADYSVRRRFVLLVLLFAMSILIIRAVDLQVMDRQFLQRRAEAQYIREVPVSSYRGMILDRHGEPLAISTPVQSVGMDPRQFHAEPSQRLKLAKLLGLSPARIDRLANRKGGRRFGYLKRRINPALAEKVTALQLEGVYCKSEYRRYYPAGEVTAHLVGFTNVDDAGQEGLELAYDEWLSGKPGAKRVIRDGARRIIEDVENVRSPTAGRNLTLSIDQRLQYLAYRELKAAVRKHKARTGSLVMLDARNGEILAMVNQPSFNPNRRRNLTGRYYRNRAVVDVFEPGSTMKPFSVACALDAGTFGPNAFIDTNPGRLRIGKNLVRDMHNYGVLNIAHILQKSSNVGVSKIALSLPAKRFWGCYNRLGFGQSAGVGFPGEASGKLLDYQNMRPFAQATLSFGYGLSGSALQLARAYSALADDGVMHSVSLLRRDEDDAEQRVMSAKTAVDVRRMLERVVSRQGTAFAANVAGYRVAGKTGTVKKTGRRGYSSNRYIALFAGIAPATRPAVVIVVVIDEPSVGGYYGGQVAAPVFSRVMSGTLRLLGIAPDREDSMPLLVVHEGRAAS